MDKEKDKLTTFSLSVYGDITSYNEVLSKARCRIFYKGANRNGTFITDEFAEQLISTLPYVPVKGIYDTMKDDFTDHGRERYDPGYAPGRKRPPRRDCGGRNRRSSRGKRYLQTGHRSGPQRR